jgi:hypothetical protein
VRTAPPPRPARGTACATGQRQWPMASRSTSAAPLTRAAASSRTSGSPSRRAHQLRGCSCSTRASALYTE